MQERRQSIDFSFRIGPNDETILVIDGEEIVFLTGNNAMCVQVNSTEMLIFGSGTLIVFGSNIGPFTVSVFHFLGETSTSVESTTVNDFRIGPGTLFLSTSRAFFTNNPVALDIIAAKATAQPLRTTVQVLTDMSEGRQISILDVDNGNFTMRLTGSPTKILDIFTNNRIIYRDNTLTVELGVLDSIRYQNIFTFAVLILVLGTTDTQYNVFSGQSSQIVQGPGQVYVGVNENKAFYVEDFSFRTSGRDVSESINRGIFEQAFRINEETSGITQVLDSSENELVTLFMDTSKFDLSNAAEVTYTGSQQLLTFRDEGGNINSFRDIQKFTIYDNNTLETFTPLSPEVTFFMCIGGTIFIDFDRRAIFVSKSNPIVISEFCAKIPLADGVDYVYGIVPDNGDNRILTVTMRDITTTPATETQTMTIQHVTGLYTTAIGESEAIKFINNEILIKDFFDAIVGQIGEVDTLFVNTENSPFRPYENESPIPFRGPGTLSYSRGNAFFTTDQALGQALSFQAKEAPIPIIDFEVVPIQMRIIDGIKYTESTIIQMIGGERVVTYESKSYTTSEDQEILYAGNIVTVHQPTFIREGNVTLIGAVQTVIYMDMSGFPTGLQGVTTFYDYSGGNVRVTMSPNDINLRGPGKLYVSEDGSVVLFSTSNVITPEVADIIRQGVTHFSVDADQFSSIVDDIFNISTVSATVTYPGGGVIRSSTFNGSRESLYVDDVTVANRIERDVSVYLNFTTADPAANQGIVRIVINGQNIYSYMPITGNNDIVVRRTQSFLFNDTTITGLKVGSFTGINTLITYDGIEIKNFNSSDTPVTIPGYGLLLVQSDSDTAFFTTIRSSIEYLLDVIKNVEKYIIPPRIKAPRIEGQTTTTKKLFDEFRFGTNVRAFAGSSITFTCKIISGRPKPTVEFFRQFENGSRILLNNTQMGITIEGNTTTSEYSLTLSSIDLDDSGTYVCRAENTIPPAAESNSTLLVREAGNMLLATYIHSSITECYVTSPLVAPLVLPGYLPFDIISSQRIFWPSDPPVTMDFETQVVKQLVFACRVDGRPEADVVWSFNGVGIEIAIGIGLLNDSSVNTEIITSGRSVLTIDVEPNQDILRGENEIECFAENAGGSTTGTVTVQGVCK